MLIRTKIKPCWKFKLKVEAPFPRRMETEHEIPIKVLPSSFIVNCLSTNQKYFALLEESCVSIYNIIDFRTLFWNLTKVFKGNTSPFIVISAPSPYGAEWSSNNEYLAIISKNEVIIYKVGYFIYFILIFIKFYIIISLFLTNF